MTRQFVAALAAVLLLVTGSAGADPARTPTDFVTDLGDRLLGVLKRDLPRNELQSRLQELFTEAFDVPVVAKFVLGRHWNTATESQQQEYLGLFGDYVGGIYATQFSDYSGETFEVRAQTPLSGGDVLVRLDILRPDGPPLPVDFRVRQDQETLRIVDVAVEGLSLIVTKRDEFGSLVQREGMEGLLEALRRTSAG